MRKTYRIFKYFFPILIGALALVSIVGAAAFSLEYDREALTLNMKSPMVIGFMALVAIVFIAIIVFSIFARKLHFERIKKHTRLTSFCASFAAIMAFGAFVNDIVNITVYDMDFTVIGLIRSILNLVVCAYFVIEALPRFINRKWVEIPLAVRQTLSVASILWAVIGIFTIYFNPNEGLLSTSIIYNGKIVAYTAIALFFVFEAEREFAKAKYGFLVFSALFSALVSFALSVSLILAFVVDRISLNELGFTLFDHLFTAGIGLFAISRTYSIFKTLKLVLMNGISNE